MAQLTASAKPPEPRLLWQHAAPESTRMYAFKELVSTKYNVELPQYQDFYNWSIINIASFWEEVWNFTSIVASKSYDRVLSQDAVLFPPPVFFSGARLNFAQNLLYPACGVDEESDAVICATENSVHAVSWKQLRERARQCTASMKAVGIKPGDRVAGYVANHTNTLIAMLSTAAIGAIWTGVSPDTGVHAVLERLLQIQPKLLFADNAVTYNGKIHDVQEKACEIAAALKDLKIVVVFETVPSVEVRIGDVEAAHGETWSYHDFIDRLDDHKEMEFAQLPPDHPIYILYSSGTTGKPKCIVHGAIGTLIQHKKEHEIHCDIRPGDRFFYFTTCTWMMWHWLVSGLASGATVVLYDGSPFRPLDSAGNGELAMPRLIDQLKITHFGTSAKYLSMLEQKGTIPNAMPHLRAIYSTGSPLAPSTFEYVYRAFGPDINLGSITGGTDIISLFGAPSLLSPVYAGEIQVRGLGMAVEVWNASGKDITMTGEPGDLVCVRPFPCQPVMFWGPSGEATYRKSYFEHFPGVWHHGDFVRLNPTTGGMVMLGRSDGVLKPAGVRFGSAEIYNVLLRHFTDEVADALCIGRRREQDHDETVVLFLKMIEGRSCDEALTKKIREVVRKELSARHVPGIIDECPEIPVTTNGKK